MSYLNVELQKTLFRWSAENVMPYSACTSNTSLTYSWGYNKHGVRWIEVKFFRSGHVRATIQNEDCRSSADFQIETIKTSEQLVKLMEWVNKPTGGADA